MRLLLHFDIGMPYLAKMPFSLGDKQRRGIRQRDETELGSLHSGPRLARMPGGESSLAAASISRRSTGAFRIWRRLRPRESDG